MKNFAIGLCIGLVVGGAGIAWAGGQFTWVFPDGNVAGTPTHPIYIQIQ